MQSSLFSDSSEEYYVNLYKRLRATLTKSNSHVIFIFKNQLECNLKTNYRLTPKQINNIKNLAYHLLSSGKPVCVLNDEILSILNLDANLGFSVLKFKTQEYQKALVIVISEQYLVNAASQIAQLTMDNYVLTFQNNYVKKLEKENRESKMYAEKYAALSHDFKTPLNVVLNSVLLLKMKLKHANEEIFNQNYAQLCGYTEENIYRILRLVSNILDVAKIDSQNMVLDLNLVDFEQSTKLCAQQLSAFASNYGITVNVESKLENNGLALLDIQKFDKVLLNLISNAITSIYKSKTENGKIDICVSQTNTHYVLTVKDNGCGIDAQTMPKIFDLFYSKQEGAGFGGTGIGLSLVKYFVELHEGKVEVENDGGAIFICTFSKSIKQFNNVFYSNCSEYFAQNENEAARLEKYHLLNILK